MIAKLPVISSAATLRDIRLALFSREDPREGLRAALADFTGFPAQHIFPVSSGIAAYLLILKSLAERGGQREVILPAYTAGSLVVAVQAAGLKPVLCDISLSDFNLDRVVLYGSITPDTLCVTACHMFGIGMHDIGLIRKQYSSLPFLIEDCAQSMGSLIGAIPTGDFGDISFFSFNRGKNLPLSGGGCIAVRDEKIAAIIGRQAGLLRENEGRFAGAVKSAALWAAGRPFVYGAAFSLIRRFKETAPPAAVSLGAMGVFEQALGARLMARREALFSSRYDNGSLLLNGLRGIQGIRLPVIAAGDRPVFNRFPVIIENAEALPLLEKKLWEAGIESSRMYLRPLHHMFDLGYDPREFPNGCYLANHLLALPCHPACTPRMLEKMVRILKQWA